VCWPWRPTGRPCRPGDLNQDSGWTRSSVWPATWPGT
jgi:hypothetical protein